MVNVVVAPNPCIAIPLHPSAQRRWQKTPRRIQSFFDPPACQYARI